MKVKYSRIQWTVYERMGFNCREFLAGFRQMSCSCITSEISLIIGRGELCIVYLLSLYLRNSYNNLVVLLAWIKN